MNQSIMLLAMMAGLAGPGHAWGPFNAKPVQALGEYLSERSAAIEAQRLLDCSNAENRVSLSLYVFKTRVNIEVAGLAQRLEEAGLYFTLLTTQDLKTSPFTVLVLPNKRGEWETILVYKPWVRVDAKSVEDLERAGARLSHREILRAIRIARDLYESKWALRRKQMLINTIRPGTFD